MPAFLKSWAPNVWAYRVKFLASVEATAQMFLIASAFTLLCGFFFGILLTVTRKGGIRPNAALFRVVDTFINIFRSIPFVILLIFLIPFTRALVGTAIGVKGAVVPLVFGAVPFFARQVETVIVFRVCLPEAVPELIRVVTITAISLIGLTSMAGAVGAGGIGGFAINYGQNLHHQDIVNVCVAALLVAVSLLQALGSMMARRTTNRRLFRPGLRVRR